MVILFRDEVKSHLTQLFSKSPNIVKWINPTYISIIGTLLSIVSSYMIISNQFLFALILYALAASCDIFDGAIARSKNISSPLGTIIDGLMDRLSDSVIVSSLIITDIINLPIGLVILSCLILIPYVRTSFERFSIFIPYGRVERMEANLLIFISIVFLAIGWLNPIFYITAVLSIGLIVTLVSNLRVGFNRYHQKITSPVPLDPEETTLEDGIRYQEHYYAS